MKIIAGIESNWVSSPLVAWQVPWRAVTCEISWAITPASSDSSCARRINPLFTKKKPPGRAKAFTSSESITLIVKGTFASELRTRFCPTRFTYSVTTGYVNRVGQNLVRNSDAKVPFTIKVIDSDEVNAFALPGGFFFVNSGLILRAQSEAELAGVMAHEIAHVAARHGTKQATKGEIINIASIPLIFMGGWAGYAIRQGASV